jgi:hypothetical protein
VDEEWKKEKSEEGTVPIISFLDDHNNPSQNLKNDEEGRVHSPEGLGVVLKILFVVERSPTHDCGGDIQWKN